MARFAKIRGIVGATMLPRNDVLDVESDKRQFILAEPAVLATVARTLAN